jgi:hypothetical protein
MTTTVTIRTASHPAQVITFPRIGIDPDPNGEWSAPERIEPNSERTFYAHSGQDICVQELQIDAE